MKKYKKQFLAAVMVAALGAAVYLNWSLTSAQSVSKTLGESKYVSATVSTSATKSTEKKTSSKLSEKQQKAFAKARTERSKVQDKVIDTSNEVLKMENVPEDKLTAAQSRVAGVIKNFTLQDTIETTLKAKGFSDCLCYINDSGAVVTLPKGELNDKNRLSVNSTVKNVAGVDFDKITIVEI